MAVQQLYDEKVLFQQIGAGDGEAFRVFFNLYKSKLHRFMLRISKSGPAAEELAHDVFLKIWTNRHLLSEVDNPAVYIFTVARNRAVDHLRKVSRELRLLDEVWANINEGHNPTEEIMDANESSRLIREAINRLPPRKQLIFRLSRDEGLSHERIAARLNISRNTVNNHLVQSLRTIRQHLRNHPDILLLLGLLIFF